jgi:hypothetical protein
VELPAQEPRRQGQQGQQGHQQQRQQQRHQPTLLHGADSYQAMNEAMQVGVVVLSWVHASRLVVPRVWNMAPWPPQAGAAKWSMMCMHLQSY